MKNYGYAMLFFCVGMLGAAEVAGVPRDSNTGNTGGYDGTRVQAQLVVQVDKNTDVIHFVRDNNDPRVVTKTYLLKNVDAYEFRDYLRQMVQAKRVGNVTLQQSNPGNTTVTPMTATVSTVQQSSVAAQSGFTPAAQLGSNTAVECLKYADGTGLLIVSAEEYRFRDSENGMGIDTLVSMLDDPKMGALNYGSQMFIYMPKYVPARNLLPLIQNVGMNVSDATELWQGQDIVTNDGDLNWLIFDVTNYSSYNVAAMLAKYDVPVPQVRLRIKVYEIFQENDEKIGLDFQNWKNNEGADFFSAGGRYRSNWEAVYGGGLLRNGGSERTSFFNFNPKWNTRYLDFLAARGKAKITHTGELLLRNNTGGSFARTTQIFYSDDSQPVPNATTTPPSDVGPYELLSQIIGELIPTDDIPVGKGNQQIITKSADYGFKMTVSNVSVNLKECRFNVTLANTSLIGFLSNGAPRISKGNTVTQDVSLPFEIGSFVIGGLTKKEVVRSRTGIPWLCEIPYLEYIFSSVSTSVKNSELVVVGSCEWDSPELERVSQR